MLALSLTLATHLLSLAACQPAPTAAAASPAAPPARPAAKAAAQPRATVPSPVTTDGTLQSALDRANSERRVLIVGPALGGRQRDLLDRVWTNPVLAAWAKRHATIYGVTRPEDKEVLESIEALLVAETNEPVAFLDSKQLRIFGSPLPQRGSRIANPKTEPALGTLLKLDWTLMKKAEGDTGLAASRGEPAKAEFDADLTETSSRIADAVGLSADRTQTAGRPDAEAWLREVLTNRAAIASPDPATKSAAEKKMVTLYFSGIAIDALLGARLTVLARELAPLAKSNQAISDQLASARRAMLMGPWYRDGRLALELIMLSRTLGDDELPRFLDDSLNDPDAVAAMPSVERAKYELLLRQIGWGTPGNAQEAAGNISAAARRMAEAKPQRFSDAQWAALRPLRIAAGTLQAGRAVALLQPPTDASTSALVNDALKRLAESDAALSRAVACAALAAGQAKPALALLTSQPEDAKLRKLAEELSK